MRRDEVLKILHEHRAQVSKFGVKSLAVFGSVARDEARTDSDVDLLVEFDPPPTFERYMDLKFYLEELLGCPKDLGTAQYLKAAHPAARSIRGGLCRVIIACIWMTWSQLTCYRLPEHRCSLAENVQKCL